MKARPTTSGAAPGAPIRADTKSRTYNEAGHTDPRLESLREAMETGR